MEDSVNIQDYYQLRGTAAEGAADRWLSAVRRDARDRLAKMDPMMRKSVGAQIDRWTAGRYENLKAHETREVRSGKIAELSLRMDQSAASTAADVALSADSEARSISERRSALMATPDTEERAKAIRALDDERAQSNDRRLAQLAAETADREREWNNAVEQGLFSPEEARVRALANRKSAYSSTIRALLDNGNDDAAEAILDALEAEGGPRDAKTGKGRRGHLGTVCGFCADDLARFREGIGIVRARRDAERRRAEAEAKEAARDAAREKEVKLHLQPIPADAAGQAAHFEQMAADYAALAQDPSLDASTRLSYAKTAESLGYHSMSRLEEEKRERKAAAKEAQAEAREQAREAREQAREAKELAESERKANEDGLARALCQLQMLELEGSIPQKDADEAQAAIWRKFHVCAYSGKVSPSFMNSFQSRMTTRLSDQERNAMRKFYQAFGYKGEVNARGEVPADDQKKDTTDYYAPRNPGDRHSDNYFRIPAPELFAYGDSLLRTLRAMGPDMNREGVVEREIARLKTDWRKKQYDRNRDATVRSVMDMQREARMRQETAQPEKRSEDDDGRREQDKPAK